MRRMLASDLVRALPNRCLRDIFFVIAHLLGVTPVLAARRGPNGCRARLGDAKLTTPASPLDDLADLGSGSRSARRLRFLARVFARIGIRRVATLGGLFAYDCTSALRLSLGRGLAASVGGDRFETGDAQLECERSSALSSRRQTGASFRARTSLTRPFSRSLAATAA